MSEISNSPKVSVVMSVYNGEAFLREAVESILAQTFKDFEFIIVDDGSVDGSKEILRIFQLCDPRVQVIYQANTGLTKSLNIALAKCSGEYVARMDADDIALPQRFEKQLEAFESQDDLVLLGSEVELISHDGFLMGSRNTPIQHNEIRRQLLLGNGGALTHPAVMIRSSALRDSGFYDERFVTTQDLDLFLRLSEIGKVANLPETLLQWRQHEGSVNHTRSSTWMAMKRLAIGEALNRIGPGQFIEGLIPDNQSMRTYNNTKYGLAKRAYSAQRFGSSTRLLIQALKSGEISFASGALLCLSVVKWIRQRFI